MVIETSELQIVLLPGMDGTGIFLDDLTKNLKDTFSVNLVHYPLDREMGYEALTEYVIDLLPDGPLVILGESFSGPIAIEIAKRMPDRVAALILAVTFAKHPVPEFMRLIANFGNPDWIPKRLVEGALFGNCLTSEWRTKFRVMREALPTHIMKRRAVEVMKVDKIEALRHIHCPTLSLISKRDRLIAKSASIILSDGLANCQVVTFDAPHMLLKTHALEVSNVIKSFCREISTPFLE